LQGERVFFVFLPWKEKDQVPEELGLDLFLCEENQSTPAKLAFAVLGDLFNSFSMCAGSYFLDRSQMTCTRPGKYPHRVRMRLSRNCKLRPTLRNAPKGGISTEMIIRMSSMVTPLLFIEIHIYL